MQKVVKKNLLMRLIFLFTDSLSRIKREIQIRTYWGRGTNYKKFFHFFVISVTIFFVLTGFSSRVSEISANRAILREDYYERGNIDTLQQGVGIQTTQTRSPMLNFKVTTYSVNSDDTINSVSEKFNVSKETIKWANQSKIDFFTEKLVIGDQIVIPEISGVLYEVKEGDNIDSVIKKTNGNRFEVIEINQLLEPDFPLTVGSKILIPNGNLPPPPPPIPYQNIYRVPTNVGVNIYFDLNYPKLNEIQFLNPLSNPDCSGYIETRGFLQYHNGADLAKAGGCPVRAAASGRVIFSGWSSYGEGFNVRIDHGNGVQTVYYHGDSIWVKTGQSVTAGQEIMYMWTSGNSTGIHLHLGLKIDGVFIDPSPYVPY